MGEKASDMGTRPVLLDLYCGAGGAAVGYERAGFKVVGVDIAPQPHYPFEFWQGDAIDLLGKVLRGRVIHADREPWRFDAIHASPPCQRYSMATPHERRERHPDDLLPPTRAAVRRSGLPWVIENVPGAPLRADFSICGCQVGLPLRRRRLFETSWQHFDLNPPCNHEGGPVVSVVGHGTPSWVRQQLGYNPTIAQYREAMGIDWMNRNELSEAIPPAYTQLVGSYLLAEVDRKAA